MKRIDISLLLGLLISILVSSFSSFAMECDDIRHEVIRLHILANSDEASDQALKLAVRDAILEGTAELFTAPTTKDLAEELAAAQLKSIEEIARDEIVRQGYSYPVSVRLVNRYFETREYDGFTMPAGHYDAVQIEIGAGLGKNWWCVMFPPLCIPAASEASSLEEQIRNLGETPRYTPAFAVVEFVERLQEEFGL